MGRGRATLPPPLPLPRSPEDPAVGVPAEGLLVLGHVVEWAELVLVPGGRGRRDPGACPAHLPRQPAPTHVDSTRLKHLPESLKRCAGPGGRGPSESSADPTPTQPRATGKATRSAGPASALSFLHGARSQLGVQEHLQVATNSSTEPTAQVETGAVLGHSSRDHTPWQPQETPGRPGKQALVCRLRKTEGLRLTPRPSPQKWTELSQRTNFQQQKSQAYREWESGQLTADPARRKPRAGAVCALRPGLPPCTRGRAWGKDLETATEVRGCVLLPLPHVSSAAAEASPCAAQLVSNAWLQWPSCLNLRAAGTTCVPLCWPRAALHHYPGTTRDAQVMSIRSFGPGDQAYTCSITELRPSPLYFSF